jgi:hypothetical protein
MKPAGGARARTWATRAFALGGLGLALGCGPAPARPVALAWPHTADLRAGKARLAQLRATALGDGPRTLRLALELREPFRGRVMEARGAVAIAPEPSGKAGALRMILLGPGGTTALDLWANGDRFRFAVPAIELLRRGDAATPPSELRGLPVGFLRWWMLRPASGELVWYEREAAADRFVLRDGPAWVDLRLADGGAIEAVRTTWAKEGGEDVVVVEERVEATGVDCASARYVTRIPLGGDGRTGLPLDIRIRCEGADRARAPNPRAFEDPDAPADAPPSAGGAP